ncbi:MAG: hypothetical protein E7173_02340 [Firmicutes bacterium]|nr:hypothetical protein [Bacillota bacterium]
MKSKVWFLRVLLTVGIALVMYYFLLPPLNLTSPVFWFYVFFISAIYLVSGIVKIVELKDIITNRKNIKKNTLSLG